MSEFLKNDMFDVFQQSSLKRKPIQPPLSNDSSAQKKLKSEHLSKTLNPMKILEENINDLPLEKLGDSDIEEEKDQEVKELTEKEKELQKKYLLEKFDIEVITEDFGCVHEIVAPKGFQRKGDPSIL